MSWGSEGGAEVVEKWCIWSSFLIGFGHAVGIQTGSEGGRKVVPPRVFSGVFRHGFWARCRYTGGGCGRGGVFERQS